MSERLYFRKPRAHPVQQGTEPPTLSLRRHRPLGELRLSSLSMRLNDQASGDPVGRHRPKVATDNVQAKVDPRRTSC